ncbi:RloB domain-containing protein [Mesomycoplasma neurolyticum]|uniref:Uncharacterized protein n=1 Tax=Mesomycoplasma neurolyticum TaxID=2120 RepID=A0A449A4R3_9BACT|nr:RloB domain-containing protein [Mesomycoplasma neurolyticum]VEU59227.1 Uncharacterised protein [Mesomycoplasma neurolyticum]
MIYLKKNFKKENINIIFSNIDFEIWLLAHFKKIDSESKIYSRSELNEELGEYLKKKYKKSNIEQLKKIVENWEQAIQNTKDISKK